ncbi:hypothetical protein [Acinetobacter soli]|uniref:hypothetical protein n=1 Tax=Acinetobacter soli TaxID=487316 RepID=UPI00148EF02A
MKLATLKDGSRDGRLVIVSKDLKTATLATGIALTLQDALENFLRSDYFSRCVERNCGSSAILLLRAASHTN